MALITKLFLNVLDGIWEINNYLTTFRIYSPFCTFGRSEFISGIHAIVSPGMFRELYFSPITSAAQFSPQHYYQVYPLLLGNTFSAGPCKMATPAWLHPIWQPPGGKRFDEICKKCNQQLFMCMCTYVCLDISFGWPPQF